MPAHLQRFPRIVLYLFALGLIGCPQKPWTEVREITSDQRLERENIMTPIFQELVPGKREKWNVTHAPSMEGKPAADYQRLLDLADFVSLDPVKKRTKYFYVEFFDPPPGVDKEDGEFYFQRFIIGVRENRIEYAELPPTID